MGTQDVTYALGRVVSIWMGLYYNLPRLRAYGRTASQIPSISESLEYLGQQRYRSGEAELYWKMRGMFNRLQQNGCDKAVSTLENAWKAALEAKPIPFSEPQMAVSLIDFPRYSGASWPHNDIAVHFPNLGRTAVMKISDSRFRRLRDRLMVITKGMDPFIGSTFSIGHSKYHPFFNRVTCSRAMPVDTASFKMLNSYNDHLDYINGAYVKPPDLRLLLQGSSHLDLQKFIIARYGSGYALMQFVSSEALVQDVTKHPDANYSVKLDVDGYETNTWMFRNVLFDPDAEPRRCKGKSVRFSAFVLVGRSAIEDYRASMHVLSIVPSDRTMTGVKAESNEHSGLISIKEVEDELLALSERQRQVVAVATEEKEIEQELIASETPAILKPQFIKVSESDFSKEQGRILVILASNRNHDFRFGEILSRLANEGIQCSRDGLFQNLQELCAKEFVFLNIFGDKWTINPMVRVSATQAKESPEAVQPRILELLKNQYPKKVQRNEIIKEFCTKDSRLTPNIVLRAVSNLQKLRQILVDKRRYYWNPNPPKAKTMPQRVQLGVSVPVIHLDERQIQKVPTVLYAYRGEPIEAYINDSTVKKGFLAFNFEQSSAILAELIDGIRNGKYGSIYFKDELGGFVKIWKYEGRLNGTYRNYNKRAFNFIENKLR